MPAEFQKAMDRPINLAKNTCCFLIVSKGDETEHGKLVEKELKNLNDEN